jgi:iron complex outermembrane receptor protein
MQNPHNQKLLKAMRKVLLIICLLLGSNLLLAQQTITGKVVSAETNEPVSGAVIKVKGTQTGTTSAFDGSFSLRLEERESIILEISFIGYETREITIEAGERSLSIVLTRDVRQLGAVIVTATRNRQNRYDVPIGVDVLEKEKVEAIPALSADDYLRAISGISVSRGASFLGSATVSMRGMGSEAGRTLVMIDGVPVNKTDGGSVNWNAINAENIEQIEVMKGPGSSIHGGNAMGGVINLISPTPSQNIEGSISQSYGTFETANTQANIGGRNNNLFWGINGRYRMSDGYITTPADEVDEFSVASFLEEYQAGGRAGYFLNADQMLEASLSYYLGQRGTGAKFTGYGFENDALAVPDGAYNEYTALNGRLLYRGSFDNNSQLNITLYGQRENYQNIRESVRNEIISRYDVESVRDDMGFLSSFTFNPLQNHIVTTGIDLRHGAVDGADIYLTSTDQVLNLGKMNQLGVYLQDEIRIAQTPWSVLAGIRFDYSGFYDGAFLVENPTNETAFLQEYTGDLDDANFSAFSPRLSLQYHIPQSFRIYAGYSRGFRAPVLDDMCRTGRISGGMKLANPDLQPEYLDNFEVGGNIFLGNRITISPAVFFSQGKDYHAYIATGDSLILNNRMRPIRIKDNIGKVEILGAELGAQINLLKGFDWNLSYSYTDTKIAEYQIFDPGEDDNLVGKQLVYQPRDMFYTALTWRNPIVNTLVSFNYKGSQWLNDINTEEIEAFSYIDLQLWRPVYRGLSVSLKVHNLLNQDFVDSRNMIAPGRMINAKLKYSF